MIRLRKIINELETSVYENIRSVLEKNKADNFLYLFTAYRGDAQSDDEIIAKLEINKNSFYVLKSRLYEKIQHHLTGDVVNNNEDVLRQMQQINEKCFNGP